MSAYLCSNDTLSALTTFWELYSDRGADNAKDQLARAFCWFYDSNGKKCYSYSHGIEQALKAIEKHGTPANAVFQLLLNENVKSLQARYPNTEEMWAAAEGYRFRRSSAVLRWTAYKPCGHGNLVGMARGYSYQSCEHEGWEQSTALRIIEQIENYLLKALEERDCGTEGQWASYTEVPAAGGPVLLSKLGR